MNSKDDFAFPRIVKKTHQIAQGNITSIDEANHILMAYELPQIDLNASPAEIVLFFEAMAKAGVDVPFDIEQTRRHLERIEEYRKIEADCDRLEIEMAHMFAEEEDDGLYQSDDELCKQVEFWEELIRLQSKLNSADISRINDVLSGGSVAESLEFMKEETIGTGLWDTVVNCLENSGDVAFQVIRKVLEKPQKVEELKDALMVDRVDLLRIIYQLCAKNILYYDRLKDTVNILREELV